MLSSTIRKISAICAMLLTSVLAFAQEKKIDIDINTKQDPEWYMQPWAWVVGGAVFVLLLVALLRRKSD